MARLLDQFGNAIEPRRLLEEEATPALAGVRSIHANHPSRGLTPQKLASLLREAEQGDATRYLELAEDMEEKDLHYLAQLSTRKRAVAQLDLSVESASDSAADIANADLIREFLRRDDLEEVLMDILDAIGKGFSVCEILWETSAKEWSPKDIIWRDPRWFAFDRVDGTTLKLREGAELLDMTPFKYITHIHKAKSGLPIRGGLARAAGWVWLFKNFGLKDWVAFAEVYGQPYRVGKYQPSATEDDKSKLLRAVSSIGSDAAAIIPEGMLIEFIEAQRSGSITLYKDLCGFLDDQLSKAILGQTLTSDVSSRGGGNRALGEVHDKVRGDIMRSDARQLGTTLNRCLVRPLIDLNRGPQEHYPRIKVGLPDELSTMELLERVEKLVPMGLRVEESVIRDRLGLPDPPKEAVVLTPSPAAPPPSTQEERPLKALATQKAIHAEGADADDAIDDQVATALKDAGWEPQIEPLLGPVRNRLKEADTPEKFRALLGEILKEMDAGPIAELLARNAFAARIAGELGIETADVDG